MFCQLGQLVRQPLRISFLQLSVLLGYVTFMKNLKFIVPNDHPSLQINGIPHSIVYRYWHHKNCSFCHPRPKSKPKLIEPNQKLMSTPQTKNRPSLLFWWQHCCRSRWETKSKHPRTRLELRTPKTSSSVCPFVHPLQFWGDPFNLVRIIPS